VRRAGEGEQAHAEVEAKGLDAPPEQKLEYSAPNDAGEVEVRNERGQVQQAATAKLQRDQAQRVAQGLRPEPAEAAPAARGAFGQRTDAPAAGSTPAAPVNRADRRAASKRK
jgi:preprotein translocase subunit SecA